MGSADNDKKLAAKRRAGNVARTQRGRRTYREQLEASARASEFYARMAGKPAMPNTLLAQLPPKRDRVVRPVDKRPVVPYERDILAAAIKALRDDPRVYDVRRQNSGLFQDGDRFIRVGTPGVLDIVGMLVSGRYMELEAKRPGQKPDERQERRIAFIRAGGGIAGYFTSVEQALALLP